VLQASCEIATYQIQRPVVGREQLSEAEQFATCQHVCVQKKRFPGNLLHVPRPQLLGASLADCLRCCLRHVGYSISSSADENGRLSAVAEIHYAAQSQESGDGDDQNLAVTAYATTLALNERGGLPCVASSLTHGGQGLQLVSGAARRPNGQAYWSKKKARVVQRVPRLVKNSLVSRVQS
jgi:hypothetical protein